LTWSVESADFINRLIQRKSNSRLGANGPSEVKSHVWFKDYDWEAIKNKSAVAPFIPPNEDNFDQKYANGAWKDQHSDNMIKQKSVQDLFNGYYYMRLSEVD